MLISTSGAVSAKIINGTEKAEKLQGTSADEERYGCGSNDKLYGGDGNDRFYGGAGDDYLDGGPGGNRLEGGEGNDIFCTFFADRHIYVWNNVMRSAVYERVPAPVFPVGRVFEDVSVVSSLLARCESLARLARPIIDYRQHAASLKIATSAKWCVDFAQALGQVKAGLAGLPVSDKVHACTSKRLFLDSLFHPVGQVLAAMRGGLEYSHDRRFDASVATQVRSALSGNLAFTLAKTASQRLKMWRQRRLAAG